LNWNDSATFVCLDIQNINPIQTAQQVQFNIMTIEHTHTEFNATDDTRTHSLMSLTTHTHTKFNITDDTRTHSLTSLTTHTHTV
jgi:hypothetical protein